MTNGQINLLQLFQAAAGALQHNQSALNNADSYNHDHGDNMVNTFDTIVQALRQKQDAKPAAQLKYISQQLEQKSTSGSGKTYAQGFSQAAKKFKGTGITLENILPLLQLILGGGQASLGAGSSTDIIGSILGGLLGGQNASSSQSGQGIDLGGLLGSVLGGQSTSSQGSQDSGLGGLLGGLLGGGQSSSTQSSQGGGLGDILGGILGGQSGSSSNPTGSSSGDLLGTLIGGIVGNSKMSDSAPHTQSGQIVTASILQALAKILG
jgi:hypothetical protein